MGNYSKWTRALSGQLAYGGGRNSAIRLVDLDPDTWVEAACRIAGRNLTTRERNTHLGDLAEYRTTCQP